MARQEKYLCVCVCACVCVCVCACACVLLFETLTLCPVCMLVLSLLPGVIGPGQDVL